MSFHFSLQAVLRLRESFERRERLRLEIIAREIAKASQQCQHALLDRDKARLELQNKLRQGTTATEMQFELACDRARVRRIEALNEHLGKLQDLRRRQLEVFRKAQQQRKILENLRDRQLAAYQLIQNRREQQQMDDRFILTHAQRWPASN
jgi:flagellar export protein FliJ